MSFGKTQSAASGRNETSQVIRNTTVSYSMKKLSNWSWCKKVLKTSQACESQAGSPHVLTSRTFNSVAIDNFCIWPLDYGFGSDTSCYGPTSSLLCLAQVLEKVVSWQLTTARSSHTCILDSGSLAGHGCTVATKVVSHITTAFHNEQICGATFINLAKSFHLLEYLMVWGAIKGAIPIIIITVISGL